MANEFKVRKGLVVNGSGSVLLDIQGSQGQLFSVTDQLSGSLFSISDISGIPVMEAFSDNTVKIGRYGFEAIKVSGSVASVTGSFSGSFSGSFFGASTSASFAATSSFANSFNVAGNLTASNALLSGTLTAQTLVVQTITSSIDFVTGSTRFGSLLTNTHTFTGSVFITGSLTVNTTGTEFQVNNTGVVMGNLLTDNHSVTGSLRVTGSSNHSIMGSNLGIGNVSPTVRLQVSGTFAVGDDNNGWGRMVFDSATNATRIQSSKNGTDSVGLSFWTQASGGGFSERMVISGSNVGIGTSNPSSIFQVASAQSLASIRSTTTTNYAEVQIENTTNYLQVGVEGATGNRMGGTIAYNSYLGSYANYGMTFHTNNLNRMIIDASGRVGIGGTPNSWDTANVKVLQIKGTSLWTFGDGVASFVSTNVYYDGTNRRYIYSNYAPEYDQNAGCHQFFTTPSGTAGAVITQTKTMEINTSGYTKITKSGTQVGGGYHEIVNDTASDWTVYMRNTGATPYGIAMHYPVTSGTGYEFFYAYDLGGLKMSVRGDGGISNYQANDTNLSDIRNKKDISPLGSYWNKFKAIEIVKFKYKDQTHNDFNIGVIAQQVEEVAPEFVDVDGWDNLPNQEHSTEEPMKSIYTADLHHATIKVLQEAMAKIEMLEAKVIALETK